MLHGKPLRKINRIYDRFESGCHIGTGIGIRDRKDIDLVEIILVVKYAVGPGYNCPMKTLTIDIFNFQNNSFTTGEGYS
jgi:hypothetical protein